MREYVVDFGPTPFRVFQSWFTKNGFVKLVEDTWKNSSFVESNKITLLRKKFHALKVFIKAWCKEDMQQSNESRRSIQSRISNLDKMLDKGDENSKYFHGIIKKKRSQLAIRGVLVDGEWIVDPPKISFDQSAELESEVTYEEIKRAVWECGTNKTPGPDGFSFEFIRKFWKIINQDVVNDVHEFFASSKFPPGSNSSFITLILKKQDAKVVKDFRQISLIGSFYKIVAKILANRLSLVMSDIISDVQSPFVSKRQILDGPFILNELLSWCKYHKKEAMIFKADFEKAFDSVRWDYLDGILHNFGFGIKWRGWIQGCLNSAMGSILVNGSPSSKFKFHKGLKQRDISFPFHPDDSLTLSHLFYADDAIFIGKWDKANVITIVNMLKCFFLASGLKINILKSKIMGIGTTQEEVNTATKIIGCTTFSTPFNYLGFKVGSSSTCSRFWDEALAKISSRLSKWKVKTLSIGGRFTLIKSVLSSLPLFQMSVSKTPKDVLHMMESIRRKFFNGADTNENKMSMIGLKTLRYGTVPLKLCLVITGLSTIQLSTMADKLNDPTIIQSFRRPPREGLEEEQCGNLLDIVQSVILSDSKDRWVWFLDSTGEFSVKSARLYIDDYLLPSVGAPTRIGYLGLILFIFPKVDILEGDLPLLMLGILLYGPLISVIDTSLPGTKPSELLAIAKYSKSERYTCVMASSHGRSPKILCANNVGCGAIASWLVKIVGVLDCGCFAAETSNETLIKGFHICDLMEVGCMLGYYMSKKYYRAAKVKFIDGIFSWDGWMCTGNRDTSMVMAVHPVRLDLADIVFGWWPIEGLLPIGIDTIYYVITLYE
ncbi:RNA-directed DNA polymerase, eukaryota [Tanacetum coccineum]